MHAINRADEVIKRNTKFIVWDVRMEDDLFVCDRSIYSVDDWLQRNELDGLINEAAHQEDTAKVDLLVAEREQLGKRIPTQKFSDSKEAIAFFVDGNAEFAERAHKMVAKVDKTLGNWVPPSK